MLRLRFDRPECWPNTRLASSSASAAGAVFVINLIVQPACVNHAAREVNQLFFVIIFCEIAVPPDSEGEQIQTAGVLHAFRQENSFH